MNKLPWFSVLLLCVMISPLVPTAPAQETALIPVDAEVLAQRQKAIGEAAPEGYRLAAYLDCGSQKVSGGEGVKIELIDGKPYRFPSEAADVAETQPTIFFNTGVVTFDLSGLDRSKRYRVGLTWWDFDNGGRTQMVTVGSPDGRLIRIAVPAIRLPEFKDSQQPPAEKTFLLPVTFARDGQMQLKVQSVSGPNAVISELWIWEQTP